MEQTKLIDRIVVEIMAQDGTELTASNIANQLRMIADEIEESKKGGNYADIDWTDESLESEVNFEVLWEHECTNYGGFRMGDESLIRMHYYHSEQKDARYIIIAHNYDRENSDAYPVDGRLFATEEEAKTYLREHINDIKSNHWTATRVDGEDRYSEEFTDVGWHAEDWDDGSSLELNITQVME